MKKIIVTGGNGFIGTNLILKLIENKKYKIINIDKFSSSSNDYLYKKRFKNYKNYKTDLLNYEKIKKIIYNFKPDLVFHLAAETHVDVSLTKPSSHYDNNVKATLNLVNILNLALRKKILSKNFKFIHIGTDEIYGDLSFSSKKALDENHPLDPNNPYSASKAAAVMMVKTWYKNFGFPCIITNSVNNYGPFQFVEKLIPRSILLSSNNQNIEIYGKGQNIRSWISVYDHISALLFLSHKGKIGETYNIASGFKISNLEIAKKLKIILKGKNINVQIKLVADRLGHDRQYSINSKKILKIGWRPTKKFDIEFKRTINWYLSSKNLKYFKNIKKNLLRKGI